MKLHTKRQNVRSVQYKSTDFLELGTKGIVQGNQLVPTQVDDVRSMSCIVITMLLYNTNATTKLMLPNYRKQHDTKN